MFKNAPQKMLSAISLGFTSDRTIAASFPPSSMVKRLIVSAADFITLTPVSADPVNTIFETPLCEDKAAPRLYSLSSLQTTFTTPAGKTSCISSTIRMIVSGAIGDGFKTIEFPVRIAGNKCQTAIIAGAFHGRIDPTTPNGRRNISTRPVLSS